MKSANCEREGKEKLRNLHRSRNGYWRAMVEDFDAHQRTAMRLPSRALHITRIEQI